MVFTQVFGGQNISPAQLDYLALPMAANVQLTWPFQSGVPSATFAARKIDITSSIPGLAIKMPDASLVSPGQDLAFNNVSANTVSIQDFSGATIGSVAAGTSWMFYIRDNTTQAGLWRQFQLGAGSSTAVAAGLAGFGLFAQANTLNQQAVSVTKNATYNLTVSDRAGTTISTGGALSFTFDPSSTLTNGWFNFIRNQGTGTLTLTPNGIETIDGAASKALAIGESLIVISTGTQLLTFGYGRQLSSTVSSINIDLSTGGGTGNYTLNAAELQAQVQNYIGLETGARSVILGGGAGYWFVFNNTTGAFTTTWKVSGADPGAAVPQGSFSIIRSDGSNAKVAFTASSGTVTQVNTGVDLTGGPITTSGTIDHVNSGVTPGTYGSSALIPILVANARGHLTSVSTAAVGPVLRIQTFIANGTYTPSANLINCVIECWGGGGGGGSGASSTNLTAIGSGGGSGAYSRTLATAAAIGASKAVIIGAAGAGALAGANAGGTGGDTSVGVLCVAKGGGGGPGLTSTTPLPAGGAGGSAAAGTGDYKRNGNIGSGGGSGQYGVVYGCGMNGSGAGSPYLGGQTFTPSSTNAAIVGTSAAANTGAGGSAAWCLNAVDAAAGAGGSGFVVVTEICSS